jgi:hypothetical protein
MFIVILLALVWDVSYARRVSAFIILAIVVMPRRALSYS